MICKVGNVEEWKGEDVYNRRGRMKEKRRWWHASLRTSRNGKEGTRKKKRGMTGRKKWWWWWSGEGHGRMEKQRHV